MHTANPTQSRRAYVLDTIGNTIAGKLFFAIAGSALVAICAHVSLPLWFTPVPLTLGNMAVLLVGLTLGPSSAFLALALYLAEGAMGLPVFTPSGGPLGLAHLIGPAAFSAGYLFAYPAAAAVAGWTVRALKSTATRFGAAVIACSVATAVILTSGVVWLGVMMHLHPAAALAMGVTPFLAGEALKIAGAAGIYAGLERWKRA